MVSSLRTADQAVGVQGLVTALAERNLDRADAILDGMNAVPAQAWGTVGELHMRRRRWPAAIHAFEQLPALDLQKMLNLFMCNNLYAIQRRRPQLYTTLDPLQALTRYRFTASSRGAPMIADISDPTQPITLTAGTDPVAALKQNLQQLDPVIRAGHPLVLIGLGDGYLLNYLAHHPPNLFMDQQQVIHLIEPDPQLLLACMMIHDLARSDGPIQQERFRWYVGDRWLDQYRQELTDDPFLPPPVVHVGQSRHKAVMIKRLSDADEARQRQEQALKAKLESHYRALSPETLGSLFGPEPPRQPRVLIITSRFTTVLQYSARQAASGFRHIGWKTELLIEPSPYHRTPALALLTALDRMKPDLVFVLDHLRTSLGETIPDPLPYACWVQDLLPNLINREAASSVKPRDFVLSFSTPVFVDDHGYPQRQCIDVPMMMAPIRDRPASWANDGDEIVYVSNLGHDPRENVQIPTHLPPELHPFVRLCCERIVRRYDKGDAISTQYDLRRELTDIAGQISAVRLSNEASQTILDAVWNPLNIALYRQQALSWVVDAADQLGLSVAIYGRGWDQNPRFARFARGPVTPGPDLDALCRRAKINLNLEPYPCVTHSRLLNGLVAGGFFLIREHPSVRIMQRLAHLLDQELDESVQDQQQARDAISPSLRDELEELLETGTCLCFSVDADPIKQIRCYQRARVLMPREPVLPWLDEVSFRDAQSCAVLIKRFVNDADIRARIQADQCRTVEQRLSIGVGIQRIVHEIGQLLDEEANVPSEAMGALN